MEGSRKRQTVSDPSGAHKKPRIFTGAQNAATGIPSVHRSDVTAKSASSVWQQGVMSEMVSQPSNVGGDGGGLWSHITTLPLAADTSTATDGKKLMDFTELTLKNEHAMRPLLVCPNGYVYCEMLSATGRAAADFLATVAEPISRPENIHEYQITVFSTYAAVSVGISIDEIIENLSRFAKNQVPGCLTRLLKAHGAAFGRVKLVLRDNRHYIEAVSSQELEYMLTSRTINEARLRNSMTVREVKGADARRVASLASEASNMRGGFISVNAATRDGTVPSSDTANTTSSAPEAPVVEGNDEFDKIEAPSLDANVLAFDVCGNEIESSAPGVDPSSSAVDADATKVASQSTTKDQRQTAVSAAGSSNAGVVPEGRAVVYSFEIRSDKVGRVREIALNELRRPLLSEYDFRRDHKNPNLEIALQPTTKVRYYQERSMRKMFSNGRARSGIVVLPCGAGKTLVGIIATTTIRKSAIVLTTSAVAVDQWRRSFVDFTTVKPSNVIILTTDSKSDLPEGAAVLVSTYTMMAYAGKRSEAAERIMSQIKRREWGLLVFDEVQFAPAPAFRKVNDIVKSHCKLGLTATLVREDDLIHDLQWLIGPKLYEANWLELQEAGFLARVQCSEVWCPMVSEYFRHYLSSSHAKQRKLWVCNPNKLRVCEYLMRFHEARMDKVIVFSDNLYALREVAKALGRPFISGAVGMQERMIIINKFKTHPNFNTVFLSKVGDNAIDIPCANVVIQISFNFASRRQEAQRLGRILRPKPKVAEEFNAFFYSVVSKDTQEMVYADKRQQFIIDQGYAYKVLPMSVFPLESESLMYDDPQRQAEMLAGILRSDDDHWDIEEDEVQLSGTVDGATAKTSVGGKPEGLGDAPRGGAARRNVTSLAALSGGGGGLFDTKSSSISKSSESHPLFKKPRR